MNNKDELRELLRQHKEALDMLKSLPYPAMWTYRDEIHEKNRIIEELEKMVKREGKCQESDT